MAEATQVLAPPSPSRRRRWPWIVAACAVVLVTAAIPTGIWFVHWRASLHSLATYPIWGERVDQPAGRTIYFGGNVIPERVFSQPKNYQSFALQIDSIRPVVRQNTAGADIVVLRCTLRTGGPALLGDDSTVGHSRCARLAPFHAGKVSLGIEMSDDDIVVAVTPRHRGIVRVAGVYVRYTSGIRHAAQQCGAQIKTVTK